MNLTKKTKIGILLVILALMLVSAPFVIYLKLLPAEVSNPAVISFVEKTLNKLEYNVNYKLAIDNLLTDMMEVKNEKVGNLC